MESHTYTFRNTHFKSVSLIITTYNQERRLQMVLDSVLNLACLPSEVLIADDGSGPKTKDLVESYQLLFAQKNLPLKHVWQEDLGFRAAKSRNNAIKEATSEYIITIDTDIILSSMFIADHMHFAHPGVLAQGTRLTLDSTESNQLLERGDFRLAYAKKSLKNFRCLPLARLVAWRMRTAKVLEDAQVWRNGIGWVRSANMGFSKADFNAIEGFNEEYIGWGGEDGEFVMRFLFNGGRVQKLRFCALAYHIYHPENSRHNLHTNHLITIRTLLGKKISWKDPP
ncbi:glycosyltransferase [Helicobacter heilmannii]|uniref:Putative two-domain glycosyltransferase n=2 Tax=Helicobacter heilmannii TaxID=35817 RepID=A0A0K2XX50_HELHE|nr:glycosyltransferase [Helicobacter heilmannii]CCM11664.1 Putative two-domain glycosyltransferase [Helicobacter heilmannii ASB1.4]CRF45178.1 Putative two-domain glycosyltransferase [Helicobacter heilmannii]CRF48059.1 Putative two-domain glycosyltransferase [Helicobacter heilmannii]CRF50079.1 Putative two-domain glycosyltransferase [Helicobacter heilmannii]CRF51412.1 Putative two-domain glycosyltransferase [Helicobacter heilmannii]